MQLKNYFNLQLNSRSGGNITRVLAVTIMFVLIALIPLPIVSFPAALMLLIVLPGLQIVRWLGLYADWKEPALSFWGLPVDYL